MKIFILPILLCLFTAVYGQQYTNGLPVTGQHISKSYYHENELVIKPNFSSQPGFSASIAPHVGTNLLVELDKRSVITQTVRIPGLRSMLSVASTGTATVGRSYTFFDAFGRTSQTVLKDFNGPGTDLVQPNSYELSFKGQKNYLPYTVTYNGNSYRADALKGANGYVDSEHRLYYLSPPSNVTGAGSNGNAFSEVRTEDFGGRPLEHAGPGENHKMGSGHTVGSTYSLIQEGTELKKWLISPTGLTTNSNYSPDVDVVKMVTTVDGDGGVTISYKDFEDKTLAISKMLGPTTLTTYYIYDPFGHLAYVIPPLPGELGMPNTLSTSNDIFKNFVYAYRYDKHGRVTEKHIPSHGWTSLVYNKRNQLVLTQNAVQKTAGKWSFVKYDGSDRPVCSGIYISADSREMLQAAANSYTGALYESATPATGMGYTDAGFPVISSATGSEVHAYNYYDSYTFLANTNIKNAANSSIFKAPDVDTLQKAPHGMATASLKKVIGTADYLLSVKYYDQDSKLVQVGTQNYYANRKHANNYDVTTTTYNFDGSVHKSLGIQSVDAPTVLTTQLETFNSYDHQRRPLEIAQRINNGPTTILERYTYNAIGQLVKKKVHSANSGQDFLQHFDQTYDISGQLSSVNNPQSLLDGDDPTKTDVFAFRLYREQVGATGAAPRYNGNIAAVSWQTKVPSLLANVITQDEKTFTYSYDQLGRLTDGQFRTATISNSFREQLGYDELGNITILTRKDKTGGTLNQLNYDYGYQTGIRKQRLDGVTDAGAENIGSTYAYDETGRLKSDSYRQATNIVYNDVDMVSSVALSGSRNISYLYDAGGNKLYREASSTGGIDRNYYVNGSEYGTNGELLFIRTFFGRLVPNGSGGFTHEYFIRDHLGNIRGIYADRNGNQQVDLDEISDVADYYPFGRPLDYGSSYAATPLNHYGFGEKEKQPMTGYLDFHARQYDTNIGRWLSVDPLAEKMRRDSPYNYVFNNPIRFIDPDGMEPKYGSSTEEFLRLNEIGDDQVTDITELILGGDATEDEGKSEDQKAEKIKKTNEKRAEIFGEIEKNKKGNSYNFFFKLKDAMLRTGSNFDDNGANSTTIVINAHGNNRVIGTPYGQMNGKQLHAFLLKYNELYKISIDKSLPITIRIEACNTGNELAQKFSKFNPNATVIAPTTNIVTNFGFWDNLAEGGKYISFKNGQPLN